LSELGVGGDAVFWMSEAALDGWRPEPFPRADIVVRLEVLEAYEQPPAKTSVLKSEPARRSSEPETALPPKDAVRLGNRLRYVTLVRGEGIAAAPDTMLKLRVSGWVQNGARIERVLDQLEISTSPKNAPGGLGEVLTRALPGSQTRVWVPRQSSTKILPDLPDRDLILDIELPSAQAAR
jgi:hypothetical protein